MNSSNHFLNSNSKFNSVSNFNKNKNKNKNQNQITKIIIQNENKLNPNHNVFYYLIMFSTMLYCFSYVPIVTNLLNDKKLTALFPYSTLLLTLLSSFIMLSISLFKKFFVHFIYFLVLFISLSIILFYKLKYEHKL